MNDVVQPSSPSRKHVAVVFFHGIGQQRKYETTAMLVEAIDDWVFGKHCEDRTRFPGPRLDIKTKTELLRDDRQADGTSIVFLQADYNKVRVRFYEGYWAPATVLGTSAGSALLWLMRQLLRPVRVLRTPWRSYARLRRGDLLSMSSRSASGADAGDNDIDDVGRQVRRLIDHYGDFVREREGGRASYRDFVSFVAKKEEKNPDRRASLLALTKRWHRWHVRTELVHLATLALIGLTAAAVGVLLILAVISILADLSQVTWLVNLATANSLQPDVSHALTFLGVFLTAVGVTGFMRDYVGDIQQFVTYEDAQPLYDRRKKILEIGVRTLKHVLLDPECERVVLVGHSLGTAVALDTVLQLRGMNQAAHPSASTGEVMKGPLPLGRIQHFITCGSPIDKINYFFAALRSASRSYESIIEELRGDISSVPFSGGGRQPYVHWINFWDRGDPISGPIETVAGDVVRIQRVDNVQLASYLWPDPAAAHEGYFRHRKMISTLFGVAFADELSFAHCPREEGQRPVWPWMGPGQGSPQQMICLLLVPVTALLVIWTAIAAMVASFPAAPIKTLGVCAALLIAGVKLQRGFRLHRDPV